MTIKVGDQIPSVTLSYMDSSGPQTISTDELFKGKKVVLMAVPGAFTPGTAQTSIFRALFSMLTKLKTKALTRSRVSRSMMLL